VGRERFNISLCPEGLMQLKGLRHIGLELAFHAPFTALGLALGLSLLQLLIASSPPPEAYEHAFHVLHPLHMFLSCMATAALFYRHRPRLAEAVAVGIVGSVPFCSISDIALPYLGGALMGLEGLELHVCLIVHPHVVLIPALLGSLLGVGVGRLTESPDLMPHAGHILVSTLASLGYLAAFSSNPSTLLSTHLLGASLTTFLAVFTPCVTSDVVLPVALLPPSSHELSRDAHARGLASWLKRHGRAAK
jgi:hypothetical protein